MEMFETKQKKRAFPILAVLIVTVIICSVLVACGAPKEKESDKAGSQSMPVSTSVSASALPNSSAQPESAASDAAHSTAAEDAGAAQREDNAQIVLRTDDGQTDAAGETAAENSGALQEDERIVLRSSNNSENSSGDWMWPVPGYTGISRKKDETHRGIDINAAADTPIYAVHGGTVLFAGNAEGTEKASYGNYVEVESEDGYRFLYAHCSTVDVNSGDSVEAGQRIASVGNSGQSTGNHLHLEIFQDNVLIDPETVLSQEVSIQKAARESNG